MAYKGKFRPNNPDKYKGDPSNIVYRSSWELKFMGYLDSHDNVLEWSSEEFCIPYMSPIDGKRHRYFPDFWVKKKGSDGLTEVLVIEIKPAYQSRPPVVMSGKKPTKRYLNEVYTWGVNSAKWESADKYCKTKGWKFVVLTEHELGIKY